MYATRTLAHTHVRVLVPVYARTNLLEGPQRSVSQPTPHMQFIHNICTNETTACEDEDMMFFLRHLVSATKRAPIARTTANEHDICHSHTCIYYSSLLSGTKYYLQQNRLFRLGMFQIVVSYVYEYAIILKQCCTNITYL